MTCHDHRLQIENKIRGGIDSHLIPHLKICESCKAYLVEHAEKYPDSFAAKYVLAAITEVSEDGPPAKEIIWSDEIPPVVPEPFIIKEGCQVDSGGWYAMDSHHKVYRVVYIYEDKNGKEHETWGVIEGIVPRSYRFTNNALLPVDSSKIIRIEKQVRDVKSTTFWERNKEDDVP